ncbi:MAG TPA: tRNA (N6-isopentenyl adenosine(37)-C2)-methylthiotransferase MiaB [Actinobacteria bacterium]|nr:tRNA (N6-isopentenyl adenosine(37)-C2)-methylthiotransferase MiaB [Actinomycetota bacterium]
MRKYFIETFGCQMNEFDSERIEFLLEEMGFEKENDTGRADLIIVNTCAVREKAKNKLYGHLGRYKEFKTKNPDLLICVGGCTAQNLKMQILDDFPFVDIVFGTHNISGLPSMIGKRLKDGEKICATPDEGFDYDLKKFKRTYSFKSYLPVSVGCNNFCSYCIVPFVRGREISINPELILENIEKLTGKGVVEITLVGQNVNSYGKDLENPVSFSELLKKISAVKGLKRIRFMTSHPKDFSDELIDTIAGRDNIMPHIHLPLQSGSDRILKLMNRDYTGNDFLGLTEEIRKRICNCAITTDIIVGFPGEEEKDFYDTLDLVKKIRFERAFTFIYSKREGTRAAEFDDNIPLKVKKEFFKELVDVQNKISLEKNQLKTGNEYEVLVEGKGPKNTFEGRLEDNTLVNFEHDEEGIAGEFINVRITGAKSFYLKGRKI